MDFKYIHYPENLPVSRLREEIAAKLAQHQVLIVAGDTGSGKTTQIPKICLERFFDSNCVIGCTQPRRIAASSVALRVSEELEGLGDLVGYKIRFHDHTSAKTRIKFMTDGILLAETKNDPLLRKYGVLIIDEAHERSLNIDFLLGYLKKILPERPDLKLVIASATIDTETFSRHFDNAPIFSIEGRTYPVTVVYSPQASETTDEEAGYVDQCAEAIYSLAAGPPGDILAFLPTEKDIRECAALVEERVGDAVVLPMFGRLQAEDQKRIFKSFPQRKIVLATNIAETSITVPGIRFVVDTGLARISQYNPRARTTSLPVRPISRASCDQRKGRCGRVGPGVCIRLYTEEDYLQRDEFTLPEIRRANLADVILQMVSLGLGHPENFPFIDPPQKNTVRDGYRLLQELGAISAAHVLTEQGKIMAALPIDPCISRMLIESHKRNCLREIIIIAAVLAIQDPRIRPDAQEKLADEAHKAFAHPHSDFLSLLNIWKEYHELHGENRSWSRLKKYCKEHFLSFQRMREWLDLHEQLTSILAKYSQFIENTEDASYQEVHMALASGLLRNIARKKQDKIYQAPGDQELMIFPGSHQFMRSGPWIIAASFLETSRLYALTVATIEPEWLEMLAPHLCRYSWSNPRWSKKTGQVVADEQVRLFGLVVISGRLVNYGNKNLTTRAEARAIFIQSALLTGEIHGNYKFLEQNLQLLDLWQEAEDKMRTKSLVLDEYSLAEFYNTRLPESVYDRQTLNKWLKRERKDATLAMTEADILREHPGDDTLLRFPPVVTINSIEFNLSYRFAPGEQDDGVTIRIPLSLAQSLSPQYFDWLVPGMLPEKVTFLLKGLPKHIRKKLVPVNIAVDRVLDDIDPYKGSLYHALEHSLAKLYSVAIVRADWPDRLPAHLLTRIELIDLTGKTLVVGRNLTQLIADIPVSRKDHEPEPETLAEHPEIAKWKEFSSQTWDFAGLPVSIPITSGIGEITGFLYPALVCTHEQKSVGITFVSDIKIAEKMNCDGMLFLLRLQFPEEYKALKKFCSTAFSGPSVQWLTTYRKPGKEILNTLVNCILLHIFPECSRGFVSEDAFKEGLERIKRQGFFRQGQAICESLLSLLRKRRSVLDQARKGNLLSKSTDLTTEAEFDIRALLDEILPETFLTDPITLSLDNIDRQLHSLSIRLERFLINRSKDQEKQRNLQPYLSILNRLHSHLAEISDEAAPLVREYEEMVWEYRISVFSPEIKTRMPVSAKRLDALLQKIKLFLPI